MHFPIQAVTKPQMELINIGRNLRHLQHSMTPAVT